MMWTRFLVVSILLTCHPDSKMRSNNEPSEIPAMQGAKHQHPGLEITSCGHYRRGDLQSRGARLERQHCAGHGGVRGFQAGAGAYYRFDSGGEVRRIFNILSDRVETVARWLVDQMLQNRRNGRRIVWLMGLKTMGRFLSAPFVKRSVYPEME